MSKIFSLSDVGIKREFNEDVVFAEQVNDASSPINYVLLVADGMGGHNAGEVASAEAEKFFKRLFVFGEYKTFAAKFEINPTDLKRILYEAIFFLDKHIKRLGGQSEKSMGTTSTIALVMKPQNDTIDVLIGHVGDSRAYKINAREWKLLTKDDSLVWKYYTRGMISFDEMRTHKEKNVITQALGGDTLEKPQVFQERLRKDEYLLLSSDGLHGMINEKLIRYIVLTAKRPELICQELIKAANKGGGKDNISAAVYCEGISGKSFGGTGTKRKLSNITAIIIAAIPVVVLILYFLIKFLSGGVTMEEVVDHLNKKEQLDAEEINFIKAMNNPKRDIIVIWKIEKGDTLTYKEIENVRTGKPIEEIKNQNRMFVSNLSESFPPEKIDRGKTKYFHISFLKQSDYDILTLIDDKTRKVFKYSEKENNREISFETTGRHKLYVEALDLNSKEKMTKEFLFDVQPEEIDHKVSITREKQKVTVSGSNIKNIEWFPGERKATLFKTYTGSPVPPTIKIFFKDNSSQIYHVPGN